MRCTGGDIPAIILPANTPEPEEYWANIIEISAGSTFRPYETACAARMMRGHFIKLHVFAQKAGLSQSYVENLLRTLDPPPDEILRTGKSHPHPHRPLFQMESPEPRRSHQGDALLPKSQPSRGGRLETIPQGWSRVERFAHGLGPGSGSHATAPRRHRGGPRSQLTRLASSECRFVDFCSGARSDLPGIYTPETKAKASAKARQLRMKQD